MSPIQLDLINEAAINIGESYEIGVQLYNADDLTGYSGFCQIRQSPASTDIILSPVISVLSKDTFSINVDFDGYPLNLVPGTYQYDVLFSSSEKRFYAICGKVQILKRITNL